MNITCGRVRLTRQQHGHQRCRLQRLLSTRDNGPMPTPDDDTDKRLTDLEVKASFSEDLLDHLNDLVARQQEQIDLLMREVGKLKDRAPDTGGAARDPRDEMPPHY